MRRRLFILLFEVFAKQFGVGWYAVPELWHLETEILWLFGNWVERWGKQDIKWINQVDAEPNLFLFCKVKVPPGFGKRKNDKEENFSALYVHHFQWNKKVLFSHQQISFPLRPNEL